MEKLLGSFYYKNQNRTYVDYHELPAQLVKALIATEDKRFYRHSGIDAKGLARVVIKNRLADAEKFRWRKYNNTTTGKAAVS